MLQGRNRGGKQEGRNGSTVLITPLKCGPDGLNNATKYDVISRRMDKHTVSFRLDSDKVEALDALAEVLDRDRSYLLNEAVRTYLDVQQWHIEQIKAGLRQADAGTQSL